MIQFAHNHGLFERETVFEAVDGLHKGKIGVSGDIHLEMKNVDTIHHLGQDTFELNTGSPHYVKFGQIPEDVKQAGAGIRYNESYRKSGINVNFVSEENGILNVATYERGVEDETFSCGTGVTAAAIAWAVKESIMGEIQCSVSTKGGILSVTAQRREENTFSEIWLIGPALKVFDGMVVL
jgi:diaminopimelate epimerase